MVRIRFSMSNQYCSYRQLMISFQIPFRYTLIANIINESLQLDFFHIFFIIDTNQNRHSPTTYFMCESHSHSIRVTMVITNCRCFFSNDYSSTLHLQSAEHLSVAWMFRTVEFKKRTRDCIILILRNSNYRSLQEMNGIILIKSMGNVNVK